MCFESCSVESCDAIGWACRLYNTAVWILEMCFWAMRSMGELQAIKHRHEVLIVGMGRIEVCCVCAHVQCLPRGRQWLVRIGFLRGMAATYGWRRRPASLQSRRLKNRKSLSALVIPSGLPAAFRLCYELLYLFHSRYFFGTETVQVTPLRRTLAFSP